MLFETYPRNAVDTSAAADRAPATAGSVAAAPAAGRRGGRLATAAVLALVLLGGCDAREVEEKAPEAAEPEPLADDGAKASYSLGYRFAENVQNQFEGDIQSDAFVRGVQDQLDGEEALVDDAEAERVLMAMMEARQASAAAASLKNLEAGHDFLEQNAQREEVVTLESGLQYEVLESGEGDKPAAGDTVTTHYEGRLVDGTVFDSSYQRGEPASFPLDRVIPGWTEGLQLMSPGAKYRLYVPSDLAYGERAAGTIPPNSTLVFDVELLEVEPATSAEGEETGAAAGEPAAQQPPEGAN